MGARVCVRSGTLAEKPANGRRYNLSHSFQWLTITGRRTLRRPLRTVARPVKRRQKQCKNTGISPFVWNGHVPLSPLENAEYTVTRGICWEMRGLR